MTLPIQQDFSLQAFNTFGIEAQARFFAEVQSNEDLMSLLFFKGFKNIHRLILGGGSNILLTQDFEGLVIKIGIKGIEKIREDEESVWVNVGAGENWHEFVLYCLDNGWNGVENLSLIPGTVGAAPMQNIGAYGVEIKEVFDSLVAINMTNGELRTFTKEECKFGYRESIFKNELKNQYAIVNVTFRLTKKANFNISYGAVAQTLADMGVTTLSAKAISQAVIKIRQSKLPNPEQIGNAGSFFKNPEISKQLFEELKEKYPSIPSYPIDEQRVKVPAGWLIEQCGWKGKRIGNTGTHKDQALVLVNYGGATGQEIKSLAEQIQQSVVEKFGICLSMEVNII
ncbi:UDP-N-acetylmuramate dehydrogenase [Thermoflexibacter ruber]|uniref:UDP-N-acetylenolpyruvoylglucosamine reductase n=1 Tax=Thermoflexibacter ruber TaxID=1003 RepID=A0A1I2A855_9BACT|nr:UDP-N-acetylmuramate dehydrogenase [Thermoflexibacter ruber]SFE39996.1 UDP-N-acetylmuramate dehydrogenase [Thermoflexibacter ruber]